MRKLKIKNQKLKIFFPIITLIFLILFLALPKFIQAQSSEEITNFLSEIQINQDATVDIKETIDYYFPSPKHGIFRTIQYRYKDNRTNRYFKIDLKVLSIKNSQSQNIPFQIQTQGNFKKIKIGDPDKTANGSQTYIIQYQTKYVINYFDDYDELYWNVTGTDWQIPIRNVQTIVNFDFPLTSSKLKFKCYSGPQGSTAENCQTSQNDNQIFYSAQDNFLTIVAGWEKGKIAVLERPYEKPPIAIIIISTLIFTGILGFLLFNYLKFGRDPKGRKTIAPEFEPPDNLKPAQIGTIVDEKADFKDLSATIIDLAVKGFLKIKQTGKKDFTLIKTKEADNLMKDFEKKIFDGIFQGLPQMELKDLKNKFYQKIAGIEKSLYQDLVESDYFPQNPNQVRQKYLIAGIIISSIGSVLVFLVAISLWYLFLSIALVLGGILVIIFSRFMPRKTEKGVQALEKTLGFKEFLYRAERYRLQWQEKENIFEQYLPYAMVLGVANQWAENFKDIYKNPPDWYQGDYTGFNSVILWSSLSSFNSAAASSFSPPSSAASGGSGFSGGFSGGGFGGGGGGSW